MDLLRDPSAMDPRALPLHSKPLYWRLQEHHCFEPTEPIAPGTDEYNGDDIMNAWLPRGHRLTHVDVSGSVPNGLTLSMLTLMFSSLPGIGRNRVL